MERTRAAGQPQDSSGEARVGVPVERPAGPSSHPSEGQRAGEQLTSEEMGKVLQRAADLQRAAHRPSEPSLDLQELERIGVEAGLSREAIRRAFVELRTGALRPPEKPTLLDKLIGPEKVSAQTHSPLTPEAARQRVDQILKGELLHPEERKGTRTTWSPTPGLWAAIQRGVNMQGQSAWQKGVVATEVVPAPSGLDARSIVKIEASPGGRAGALFASLPLGAVFFALAAATSFDPGAVQQHMPLVFGGLGLGMTGLMFGIMRVTYRKRLKGLRLAVARVMEKVSGEREP